MSKPVTVVDTNVFLRYFIHDDSEKSQALDRLRAKARRGEIKLVLLPIVFLELGWVLEKFYRLKREKVATYLEAVLSTPGIKVEMQNMLSEALALYREGVKLGDAVLIAWAKEIKAEKIWILISGILKRLNFPIKNPKHMENNKRSCHGRERHILVINKKKRRPGKILLINASHLFEKDQPKNFLLESAISEIVEIYLNWQKKEGLSKVITNKRPPRTTTTFPLRAMWSREARKKCFR